MGLEGKRKEQTKGLDLWPYQKQTGKGFKGNEIDNVKLPQNVILIFSSA